MTTHSKLSPSGSKRWMVCPGSVQAQAGLPEGKPSKYALEGTAAHSLAAKCLEENGDPVDYVGQLCPDSGLKYTKDMVQPVARYLNVVDELLEETGGELYVETKVSAPKLDKEFSGTADAIIVTKHEIIVVDLKYGKGVPVSAVGNTQLKFYAMMAVLGTFAKKSKSIKQVQGHIVQPRVDEEHKRHTHDTWSLEDIKDFADEAITAADATRKRNPKRVPSEEGCHWCRAQPTCPEHHKLLSDTISADFDDLTAPGAEVALPLPEELTAEQAVAILDKEKIISNWFASLRAYWTEKTMHGEGPADRKVVHGRSIRKWKFKDDIIIQRVLKACPKLKRDDITSEKLVTPAQLEKLGAPAEVVEKLCEKPPGKPTLVSIDDKRDPIDVFED